MSEDQFTYDAETATYTATWEDCVFTIKEVFYDERRRLTAEVKAVLHPSGGFLNLQQVRLLDAWSVQEFAKDCDSTPEGQQKVRQYLALIAAWLTEQQTHSINAQKNGHIPKRQPPTDANAPMGMPSLPVYAQIHPEIAEGAAPWLEAYCEYSRQWAPRAASNFHEAIGLWVLSTVAARRICVMFGNPIYPVLFINLAAESTIYTKSTAVTQGTNLLRAAGCDFLLSPNHTTPQALIRSMHGRVPEDYEKLTKSDHVDDQEQVQRMERRLAFSAQRGWYYAEWGGMLQQMHRSDSPMSMFHELIRRLDDDEQQFSSETIQRGLELLHEPYLALLTSSTPHDLAPWMASGARYWHDGFWPRFAFIVPDGPPNMARRPQGQGRPSAELVSTLHTWHTSLGMPNIAIEPTRDKYDRPTGEYRLKRGTFPCRVFTVNTQAEDAYYAYGDAMSNRDISRDLIPSYARLPHKALRIATLLASVQNSSEVTICHWAYAQQIVERWRGMLHRILGLTSETTPTSKDGQAEEAIELFLAHEGAKTMRDIQRKLHLDSATLRRLVQSMEYTGRVMSLKEGKTLYLCLPADADVPDHEDEAVVDENRIQDDIPF